MVGVYICDKWEIQKAYNVYRGGGGRRGFGRPPSHTHTHTHKHTHTRDGLNYAQVKKVPPQEISVKLLQNKSVKLVILAQSTLFWLVNFFWLRYTVIRPPPPPPHVENPDYGPVTIHLL